ncbi:hypothetical protein QYF36_021064 [Acer negundo]|nr:hypothetical protein QYF36_021064 [Acer negundo]
MNMAITTDHVVMNEGFRLLAVGYRFDPTDQELIVNFLYNKTRWLQHNRPKQLRCNERLCALPNHQEEPSKGGRSNTNDDHENQDQMELQISGDAVGYVHKGIMGWN